MSFANPLWLLLLVAIPPASVIWWLGFRRGRRLSRLVSRQPVRRPPFVAAALVMLALASGVIAAAGPQWGERESFIPREGAQLVVVLDVSRSMGVDDVQPTRMGAAKQAVITTLKRLGGDRLGLVIFAGNARLRFPLTTDFAAATQVIESLEPGAALLEAGTNASAGLDIALAAFDPDSEAGRLVVLITDGDDLGVDPQAVAQRFRAGGVELIVAGAGTAAGGTVKVIDPRTRQPAVKVDDQGAPIVSRLNEPFLRSLAAVAGGRYAGSDLATLPGVIEGRLSTLKRAQFERQSATLPIDRSQWFSAAALLLLGLSAAAERVRFAGRRAAALAVAAVSLLIGGACATAAHDMNQEGVDAYAQHEYRRAAELFVEAQARRPNDAQVSLNLAAALHADGRFEEAALAARRALASRSAEMRSRAHASIGHHRFSANDPQGALDAFRQALVENPRDEASRHDYEVVLRMLEPPAAEPPAGKGAAQPTPADGSTTPAVPGQGSGTPTPGTAGATPSPSAGSPGQPGPSATPSPGDGAPGGPLTPAQADRMLSQIDAQIATLVQQAGDEPTAAQAFRILDLLAERARIAAQRDPSSGANNPRDY